MYSVVIDKKNDVWSDFWLDESWKNDEHLSIDDNTFDVGFSSILDQNTLKLASARRAIANFVNILTGEDIPVHYCGVKTGATDGKTVYLSSEVTEKEDFDAAVGLALHEGSHILLTDFDLIKTLWGRISELYKLGKEIGIDKEQVRIFAKLMVNYVEDRYIDNYIFSTAPGYRPYYVALYDKYFNSEIIGKELVGELMRQPTLAAYEARILNLTNPMTDLEALPGLRDIAKEISLKKISRLTHTKDRIRVASEIVKIVFKNIKESIEKQKVENSSKSQKDIQFSFHTESMEKNEDKKSSQSDDSGSSKKDKSDLDSKNSSDEEDDVLGGESTKAALDTEPIAKKVEDNLGAEKSNISKQNLQKIKKIIEEQKQFLDGHENVKKKSVSDKQKTFLDIIEKSGITLIPVGMNLNNENEKPSAVECVVVKRLNREILFSGICPLYKNYGVINNSPSQVIKNAVEKGIQLGTILGKKLQIRQESNVTVYPRRTSGKINRRNLHELDWSESIFYKIKVDKHSKLNLHISVDASSSMEIGEKWIQTMTMVVAICKAASMIDNMRVVVSFRCTINKQSQSYSALNNSFPYIVCAYDSSKDKFSKVRNLFQYLSPYGGTPEGLTFEAIMDELICKKSEELYYFLTISDGQPEFSYNGTDDKLISYNMTNGAEHTRRQYKKILQSGVKGLAYFIKSTTVFSENDITVKCFRKMYGKDAKFIDVNNVTSIARTMNDLFLNKD